MDPKGVGIIRGSREKRPGLKLGVVLTSVTRCKQKKKRLRGQQASCCGGGVPWLPYHLLQLMLMLMLLMCRVGLGVVAMALVASCSCNNNNNNKTSTLLGYAAMQPWIIQQVWTTPVSQQAHQGAATSASDVLQERLVSLLHDPITRLVFS